MILPDINLLLYAYNRESPLHTAAARWWRNCMNRTEAVGLAVPVALGFVRLSTQAAVFRRPLAVDEAANMVRTWLARPQVTLVPVEAADLTRALSLLEACGAAGNLVGDAVLAALALAHDATVHTADADFGRLQPARWRNPLRP